jgi:hypothetical protein
MLAKYIYLAETLCIFVIQVFETGESAFSCPILSILDGVEMDYFKEKSKLHSC